MTSAIFDFILNVGKEELMSFKVQYRNLEVTCESIKDVDELADRQEQRNGLKVESVKTDVSTKIEATEPLKTPEKSETPQKPKIFLGYSSNGSGGSDAIAKFVKGLGEKPTLILKALADAPNGLTDEELRQATGIDSKLVLAGTMSAIAKAATKDGITYEDILTKETTDNRHGKRKYLYTIKETVRGALLKNNPEKLF